MKNLLAIVGAIVAGLFGAFVWAAISYYANLEVGYVAWGIGLVVGVSAHALGAQGQGMGIACATIALLSMLGGKALAVRWEIDKVMNETDLLTEVYEERKVDAEGFAEVAKNNDNVVKSFMIEHAFTDAADASQVTADELAVFRDVNVPQLEQFSRENPSYEQWAESDEAKDLQQLIQSPMGIVECVKQTIGPIDLIFAFLGISTAYSLGAKSKDE
ncbi:MAG: hypothetical protein R3E01_33665 [Pirellulaceae bacterium]